MSQPQGQTVAVVVSSIMTQHDDISPAQELQTIGLPSVLVSGSTQPDVVRLVNTVYKLLQLYRHNVRTIEKLKERYMLGRLMMHPLRLSCRGFGCQCH